MRRLVALVLAVALALALAGCASAPTAGGGFVGGDGSITVVPAAERKPAPRITGTTLEGAAFDSQTIKGIIVYNVWGSWCAPCRKEAPMLTAAAARSAGTATFVGINTRDLDKAPAQAFVRSFGITYPSVFDPGGRLLLEFGSDLPPSAIPSTIIVDADGRLAARVLGEVSEATLVALIDDVAKP